LLEFLCVNKCLGSCELKITTLCPTDIARLRVTSLSVHDSFGTKGWTLSVHYDFGTYEIHFSTCVFCCTTSVHAKYRFGTSLCRYRYIARERQFFMLTVEKKWPVDVSLFIVCVATQLVCN